ncbi:MAG TPA: hypothetical protein VGS11_10990 [Candidatus Bathyarchaeia archaeon]|nr:hypothetical protein [Candidatus Bathyarchaeia archaeon]
MSQARRRLPLRSQFAVESQSETPKGQSRTPLTLAMIVILAIAVLAALAFQQPSASPPTNVQIVVVYPGTWQGAYGGIGSSGSIVSWNGNGTRSVTLIRPTGSYAWIVSANAQKLDPSSSLLSLQVLDFNGRILAQANTSAPYGVAQVELEVK